MTPAPGRFEAAAAAATPSPDPRPLLRCTASLAVSQALPTLSFEFVLPPVQRHAWRRNAAGRVRSVCGAGPKVVLVVWRLRDFWEAYVHSKPIRQRPYLCYWHAALRPA